MTGLMLMIVGILIFIGGVFVYNSSNKPVIQVSQNMNVEKPVEIVSSKPIIPETDNELVKAIEMAIADGVLSNNERKIIKEIANRKGLDYKKVLKDVEKRLADSDTESETELVDHNKKQGDDFEKFVVQKFNKKYYRIKEWAGDKYVNGVYAETTTQPDILIEKETKNESAEFWVECKWRKNTNGKGVQFASEEQLNDTRITKYQERSRFLLHLELGERE